MPCIWTVGHIEGEWVKPFDRKKFKYLLSSTELNNRKLVSKFFQSEIQSNYGTILIFHHYFYKKKKTLHQLERTCYKPDRIFRKQSYTRVIHICSIFFLPYYPRSIIYIVPFIKNVKQPTYLIILGTNVSVIRCFIWGSWIYFHEISLSVISFLWICSVASHTFLATIEPELHYWKPKNPGLERLIRVKAVSPCWYHCRYP